MESKDRVRVRFAPSPTGYLHIGGARTAIFNWLFARHEGGKFLLRIEDTDFARSDPKMVQAIYDGLTWLGLNWDEPPIFQSQRLSRYQQIAQQLIDNNHAYYCYCDHQRLASRKELDEHDERAYRYDGHCRYLSLQERQKLENEGKSRVVRLKVNPGQTHFSDEVHGSLTVDNKTIDDFIILRSDGIPTYNFAVVVDDHDMAISHVIRGDDHLSNTPKQILIYQALGWNAPKFAHVPLILGPDKKRLSKRHGATSVSEYQAAGYLPEAMLNFLALLGWSPGDDREIMTQTELIESFSLKAISKKSAVFDEAKLVWMNGEYISRMNDDELVQRVVPILQQQDLLHNHQVNEIYIKKALSLLKPKIKRLTDFATLGYYLFRDPEQYDQEAVKKYWEEQEVVDRLREEQDRLVALEQFDAMSIEHAIRKLADELSISAAKLIHPTRLALTGFGVSPSLFDLMALLGKETVIRRIERAINWLESDK
ncbi:MAG: glutamate--tRNA ligase [candidate division KSB1 bacterium]|nr:glutamate--tRNA ligase [candidate division KSB1 bacterium]MDZ7399768.1 glutamate--tRNA ligase [candidate division KSB1 bacterium]